LPAGAPPGCLDAARMNTIRSLDGLRGVAALIVVVGHFSLVVPRFLHSAARESGHAGVMIFFALSGFLMGYLYLAQAPTRHAIAQFLVRRGARVIPLYLVIVLACFATLNTVPELRIWVYGIRRLDRLIEHLAMLRGVNILWTVPVEIQFYLLVPLIWLCFSKAPRATLAGLFAAIAAIYLYRVLALPPETEQPEQGLVDEIVARLAAALPYFFAGLAISRLVAPRIGGRVWDVLFVASFAGLLACYPNVVPIAWIGGIDYWANPLCLLLVSVLLIATLRSALADRILGSRPFRFLGRVSYGVYLLHFVLISNLIRFAGTYLHPKAYILFALSLTLILLLAHLAYTLIERPARDAINRWFDRRAPKLAKQAV
jgi:peptidoglycan/LPS O-acetylase OafA/YrhL